MEAPKRLRAMDVIEQLHGLLHAALTKSAAESVTIKKNAQGRTQIEVTAVPRDGETLAQAADRADVLYVHLTATHAPATVGSADSEKEGPF